MSNPQIHQQSNPSKFTTDKSLLPSGSSICGGRESGQALFLLLVLIIAVAIGFVFDFARPTALAIEHDKQTAAALAEAKDALIGWAMSRTDTLGPGWLLWPDRNADVNYDGYSDCPSTWIGNYALLLGKLPWIGDKSGPCAGTQRDNMGIDKVDGAGERLWYAVSDNLLTPGISANIAANLSDTNTTPWLTVRDANGTVLSNLVAFIVLSSGPVVLGQNRSGPAPDATNFLDNFTVSGTTYSNWDVTLGFVSAEDTAKVPAGTNQFNDRLLYVTRDQYRLAISKRVVGEVKNQLKLFATYPSPTADPTGKCSAPPPPSYLPIDPVTCGSNALTGLPSWFTTDWESYVQYTPTGPNTAILTIFGNNFAVP